MSRVAQADSSAQSELVHRLMGRVYRTTASLLRSRSDADDATQMSLLEIMKSAGTYRGQSSLETWADRSFSGRKSTKPLEEMHRPADQFVRAHPRSVGVLVILGSIYVLANLGYALLR